MGLRVYIRHGCHLCDEALERIAEIDPDGSIDVEIVDIEADDELHRKYLELIPVIELDGKEIARLVEYRRESFAEAILGQGDG